MLQKNDTTLPYHAFGMEMPGRKWTASNYRYSHNGHEKEEEIFSGAQSAEFWMYDSRIGRRWNIDPVVDESLSPYACFNDNPIYFNDINGDSPTDPKGGGDKGGGNKGGGKKTVKHGSSKSPDGKTTKLPDTDVGGTKSPKSAPKDDNKSGDKTETTTDKNPTTNEDSHRIITFNPKKDSPISFEAAKNEKINGRPDHFTFFGHSTNNGFAYYDSKTGKTEHGWSAADFDKVMGMFSADWKKMRKANQNITVTLYGCNMAAHKYRRRKEYGGGYELADFTIAQKISMLPNVTVIAANGYMVHGLTMGVPAHQGISNDKGDGAFITLRKGKEVSRSIWISKRVID